MIVAYLNYMDECARGWEEPYQDMSMYQPYFNSWENLYYAQEDCETPPLSSSNGINIGDLRRVYENFKSEAKLQTLKPNSLLSTT